jgi:uncharacterized protein YecE (DUF72 family)
MRTMPSVPTRGRAFVGCSGWDYADWRGPFYPAGLPKRDWFPYYAAQFSTVELNATFYRLPERSTVDRWRDQAPAGFVYAFKLGQYGSHRKKLADPDQWLGNHLDRAERLGPCLGPTLVQLPPRWRKNVPRLDEFLARLPRSQRWAFEFRDRSWLDEEVFACLREHGAALCIHDLVADHPVALTTDWTYVRFHGPRALERAYHGRYTGRRLWRTADRLDAWRAEGRDVYAYFNNDYGAEAVTDARWLRTRLGDPGAIDGRSSG